MPLKSAPEFANIFFESRHDNVVCCCVKQHSSSLEMLLKCRRLLQNLPTIVVLLFSVLRSVSAQIEENEFPDGLKDVLTNHELETWEPPEEMQKNYAYYLSGFDYEKRPVWVMEFGKWDILEAVQKGEDYAANFTKYVDQFIYRIVYSVGEKGTEEDPVKNLVVIYDMEGFTFNQLASPAVISFHLSTIRKILGLVQFLHSAYCINTNYFATNFINIVRPVLGQAFSKVQVFGTNPARWIPILLKEIPQDQLPEWYGGTKEFKPVRVYG